MLDYNENEKNMYKKRIAEVEKNLREAESKKGTLLLELEKEKAKFNIEKDNLISKYSELKDNFSRLEKKNESLLRENEKLRNEKNMLRRAGATTTGRYTLMLREGGNTIGGSLISNIGLGKGNLIQGIKNNDSKNENENNININNYEKNEDNI